ncbi:hypothetical protein BURK1_03379 [Burkholderiales bacterium]|nr:hypothetical protein BURK1_03379 [Burkholderiales bacterium]
MAEAASTGAGGCLALAWHPHHVEHLAPWCGIVGMPMLLADSPGLYAASRCYPGLDTAWAHGVRMPAAVDAFAGAIRERAPRVVFYSDLFGRDSLRRLLGGRADAPRVVYVPHGFSEKRQDWARGTAFQDVAVVYGQHALDQLAALGVAGHLERCVVSGNVRRRWHRLHAAHFRAQLAALGLGDPPAGRTLLYAPTWQDAIGSSSYFAAIAPLALRLPAGWRLVVKLHPHSERYAPMLDEIEARCGNRNVHFVRNSPLTFPFLEIADAYLGDMSSLAYDYLASGRPMFFANPTAGAPADAAHSRLFTCGTVIPPDRYDDAYRLIDAAWDSDAERFGEARAALERYTHAPERGFDELAAEIADATAGPAPAWMTGESALSRHAADD